MTALPGFDSWLTTEPDPEPDVCEWCGEVPWTWVDEQFCSEECRREAHDYTESERADQENDFAREDT